MNKSMLNDLVQRLLADGPTATSAAILDAAIVTLQRRQKLQRQIEVLQWQAEYREARLKMLEANHVRRPPGLDETVSLEAGAVDLHSKHRALRKS